MLKTSLFVILLMASVSPGVAADAHKSLEKLDGSLDTLEETAKTLMETMEETAKKLDEMPDNTVVGDPSTIAELGRRYFVGDQVPQNPEIAFSLWDRATALGGKTIECQILGMTHAKDLAKTPDGLLLRASIILQGGCYFDGTETPLAFSLLHRAGQMYIDQGRPSGAEHVLEILSLYDDPISRKYARSLQKSFLKQ